MIRFFVTLLFFIGVATWAAPTFPELSGRVVDQAELLTPDQEQSLSELSKTIEDNSTAQVVVVTLKSLEGYDISDYGYQLGRYWKIGQKDKNNGLLIIIAPNDHKVRIEVGYGLEGDITDAQANDLILTKMVPRFKQKDVYGGIKDTMEEIKVIISKEYQAEPVKEKSHLFYILLIALIPLLVLIFWAGTYYFSKQVMVILKLTASLFIGGIVGMLIWIASHLVIISAIVGLIVFIITYFSNKNSDFGSIIDTIGNSSGSMSSDSFDIFSGSGGSFGGGGSSVDIGDLLDGLGS
ncbi:MAG: TPM domain-containing protein [Sulfuricurvum sp.]|uniref:TPM domain-containing protein n=1 Tax=Sulfuricurvum sp. TaxID=2025608 RepID=UPI002618B7CE|nr:TPM domain-containing protein [Sulfuricurvum sp.]MDD5159401.1 TPM domain-containing protein [Sulfuricurvum sp.]